MNGTSAFVAANCHRPWSPGRQDGRFASGCHRQLRQSVVIVAMGFPVLVPGGAVAQPEATDMVAAAAPSPLPLSVTAGLVILAVLASLWAALKLARRQRPSPAVVSALALLVAVYTASAYAVHRYMPRPATAIAEDTSTGPVETVVPEVAVPVFVERVQRGPFSAKVTCTGVVVAYSEEDVYARVAGRIVSMPVQLGDEVKPGELLVKLADPEGAPRPQQARASLAPAPSTAGTKPQGAVAGETDRGADRVPGAPQGDVRNALSELAATTARLKEAQTAAEAARSSLSRAQAELASAEADLTHWDAEIERLRRLPGSYAARSEEYLRAQAQREAAAARHRKAQAAVAERQALLASASEGVKAAQSALSRASDAVTAEQVTKRGETSLPEATSGKGQERGAGLTVASTAGGYTEIRAAGRARVAERTASAGVVVRPGALLLRLSQLHRVRLQASISPTDMTGIQVGSLVQAHILATPPRTFQTRVTSIRPATGPASAASIIEAVVDNASYRLSVGQVVTMEIVTAAVPQALTVPTVALVPLAGAAVGQSGTTKYAVWTVREEQATAKPAYTCPLHPEVAQATPGNCPVCQDLLIPAVGTGGRRTAHRVDVTTGPSDDERTQVLTGLEEGEEIIVAGYEGLKEGQPVEPVPWDLKRSSEPPDPFPLSRR